MSEEPDLSGVHPSRREEVARRIHIIDRYVRIQRPTEDDDRQAAADLGLSVDMMLRLAAAWRAHRRPELLPGAATMHRRPASQAERHASALAASDPVDLSGVHPARRAEVQRRVQAIRQHLLRPTMTRAGLEQDARLLGLHPESFGRLVRAWLAHRKAALLPGATFTVRKPRKTGKGMPPRVEMLIAGVIAELGIGAPALRVVKAVTARCREEGLKPPARNTIEARLLAARAAAPATAVPPAAIVIDHVAFDLAVDLGDGRVGRPQAAIVFLVPSGHIVAHAPAPEGATVSGAAAALMLAVERCDGEHSVPLRVCKLADGGLDRLVAALKDAGVKLAEKIGQAASKDARRHLGGSIGQLKLHAASYGPQRQLSDRTRERLGKVLDMREAQSAIYDAIQQHNSQRKRNAAPAHAPTLGSPGAIRSALAPLLR